MARARQLYSESQAKMEILRPLAKLTEHNLSDETRIAASDLRIGPGGHFDRISPTNLPKDTLSNLTTSLKKNFDAQCLQLEAKGPFFPEVMKCEMIMEEKYVRLGCQVRNEAELRYAVGPATVFTEEEEDRLSHYLMEMAEMGFGLTREDVARLAFNTVV